MFLLPLDPHSNSRAHLVSIVSYCCIYYKHTHTVVALSEIARCQEPVADVCLETLLEIAVLAPHLVALSDGYKVCYAIQYCCRDYSRGYSMANQCPLYRLLLMQYWVVSRLLRTTSLSKQFSESLTTQILDTLSHQTRLS